MNEFDLLSSSPVYRYIKKPFKFESLEKFLKRESCRVLDIGCGNHSPFITKLYYPNCIYYGVDKSRGYNLDDNDFSLMEKFYEFDLENPQGFDEISDGFFDCVILNHVIEHVQNGENIILNCVKKLKPQGVIYLEYPGKKSASLPRFHGSVLRSGLNFYDDSTHVRIYHLDQLKELLEKNGCKILLSGYRRSLKRILLLPVYLLGSILYYKYIPSAVFWDIAGFAEYIIASKN